MRWICPTNIAADRRKARAVLAGGLFLGLLVLFLVPPAKLPVPACAFHSITGHSCLTCGLTRSLHAVLHGDLADSFRYHLFGPAVLLGLLLCLGVFVAESVGGRRMAPSVGRSLRNGIIGATAILWFLYWGIRLALEFAV